MVTANEFEKYDIIEIDREQIKNAPYNPRVISAEAKRKLKENIGRVGLLTPLVWNSRTGNLVSGHQRLNSLDMLHHGKDYRVRVAAVDLDEKTEHEQNLFFNNLSAQGNWDLERLEKLLADPITIDGENVMLDLDNIGFTTAEIYHNLGSRPLEARPETLEQIGDALRKNREVMAKLNRGLVERDMVRESYVVIVFRDFKGREEFTGLLDIADNRYIDGDLMLSILRSYREHQKSSIDPSPPEASPDAGLSEPTPTSPVGVEKYRRIQRRRAGGDEPPPDRQS